MKKIKVVLLNSTPNPDQVIKTAGTLTMKRVPVYGEDDSKLPMRLVRMNHTSVLEHVGFTFMVEGASRAFLAQITRHRMASYTSGSQHYQDHSGFPYIEVPSLKGRKELWVSTPQDPLNAKVQYTELMEHIDDIYQELLRAGVPKEEARYILPNACRNNLMITINARSLLNLLNLRTCNRNVLEMRLVAEVMRLLVVRVFPNLFQHVGPDCLMKGECSQGSMRCKPRYWVKPKIEDPEVQEGTTDDKGD